MYIDIGPNAVIHDRDIIGIFDLDTATVSKNTREYLNKAEKCGEALTVSLYDLPRSFTVTAADKEKQTVVISPLSVNAIVTRTE